MSTVDGLVGVFCGLTTLDVVHRSEHAPGRNEKVTATRQDVAAGGPAANAAVVFAALGGHARLVTVLGTGAVAQIARADLERHGVEVVDVAPESRADLGVSAIQVDAATGERSVLSMDAAGRGPGTDAVSARDADRLVADAHVLLLDGHHPALARAFAGAARRARVLLVVDAGRWRPVMGELLPAATTVVASADFRWHGADGTVVGTTAPWFDLTHVQQVVTHGPDPVQWWTSGATGEVGVPPVQAVDTLGAGDAFHGAFAYYAASDARRTGASGEGGEDAAALRRQLADAAAVAALRCSIVGPREWLDRLPPRGAPAEPSTGAPPVGEVSRRSR